MKLSEGIFKILLKIWSSGVMECFSFAAFGVINLLLGLITEKLRRSNSVISRICTIFPPLASCLLGMRFYASNQLNAFIRSSLLVPFYLGMRLCVPGITGGMGSGKSTVTSVLKDGGCAVIDADEVARDIVQPGKPAYKCLVKEFGEGILLSNGEIDRAALRSAAFESSTHTRLLNSITHKYILLDLFKAVVYYRLLKWQKNVVMDASLLFETGLNYVTSPVLVVKANRTLQIQRLMQRDNKHSKQILEKMLDAQMSEDDKAKHADHVFDNTGTISMLQSQLLHFFRGNYEISSAIRAALDSSRSTETTAGCIQGEK